MSVFRGTVCSILIVAVAWQATVPCCTCAATTFDGGTQNSQSGPSPCCCGSHCQETASDSQPTPKKKDPRECPKCPFCTAAADANRAEMISVRVRFAERIETLVAIADILPSDMMRAGRGMTPFLERWLSIKAMPARLLL